MIDNVGIASCVYNEMPRIQILANQVAKNFKFSYWVVQVDENEDGTFKALDKILSKNNHHGYIFKSPKTGSSDIGGYKQFAIDEISKKVPWVFWIDGDELFSDGLLAFLNTRINELANFDGMEFARETFIRNNKVTKIATMLGADPQLRLFRASTKWVSGIHSRPNISNYMNWQFDGNAKILHYQDLNRTIESFTRYSQISPAHKEFNDAYIKHVRGLFV